MLCPNAKNISILIPEETLNNSVFARTARIHIKIRNKILEQKALLVLPNEHHIFN